MFLLSTNLRVERHLEIDTCMIFFISFISCHYDPLLLYLV